MNEVHDEKLSQLVSLGGWLRGTEVLTAVVDRRFSEDGAELLHQPDLLTISSASSPPCRNSTFGHCRHPKALQEVRPLIDDGRSDFAGLGEENQ